MFHRKYYLLNYIFILGIILLFLNDHFFKWQFSNWITGKLSDFIGLLIFPFFLTFLFPKNIQWNVIFTGVFFVFWKSSFSQDFIDFYNSITFIKITRVVDYSDYVALLILPLSYYCLKRTQTLKKFILNRINLHPLIILFPSIIVFMATTYHPYWHNFKYSEGNIKFYKNFVRINMSQNDILSKMKAVNIDVIVDTAFHQRNADILNFYVVEQLVLNKDTINNLRFSMVSFKKNKTKVFMNAMTISEDIEDADVKKELRKYYRKLLKKYIKSNLK